MGRSDRTAPAAPRRAHRNRARRAPRAVARAHRRAQRGKGDMTLTTVLYGLVDGVATITLNRPESRNALNRAMCEDIVVATSAAAADGDVRLVLIRGNGPVFCAGADLKERKDMTVDDVRNRRLRGYAAYNAIEALPMPTIAVVHGAAIGSGSEIAAACEFIIAPPKRRSLRPRRCGERWAQRSGSRACSASDWPKT